MLLAQQDNQPLFEFTVAPLLEDHGIPLAVMGILVVFVALVLVVVFITLLPRVLATEAEAGEEATAATATAATAAPEPEPAEEGVPAEIIVVIAAAVAEALGKPSRIVQIRGMTPAEMGWSLEGRMQHHHSHRVRGRQ